MLNNEIKLLIKLISFLLQILEEFEIYIEFRFNILASLIIFFDLYEEFTFFKEKNAIIFDFVYLLVKYKLALLIILFFISENLKENN